MIFYRVAIAMQNSFKSFLGWRVNDPVQLSVERWISYLISLLRNLVSKSDVLQPSNVTFVTLLPSSYELLFTPGSYFWARALSCGLLNLVFVREIFDLFNIFCPWAF